MSLKGFLDAVRFKESSNNYTVINSAGFIGGYQFGEAALQDLGYVNADGNAFDNNFSGGWTGKDGINSTQDFLNSPVAQDAAFIEWTQYQWRLIRGNDQEIYAGQTLNGFETSISGMIAFSHLVGSGSFENFIESGGTVVASDGNNVPGTQYMADFGGYDLSDVSGIPASSLPTGFTSYFVDNLEKDNTAVPLRGGFGDDVLNGFAGNDLMFGGTLGNDVLIGGSGIDHLTYSEYGSGVRVTLLSPASQQAAPVFLATDFVDAELWSDRFTEFEKLTLTQFDDILEFDPELFGLIVDGGLNGQRGDILDGSSSGLAIQVALLDSVGGVGPTPPDFLLLSGFENVLGSNQGDEVFGNSQNNIFDGGGGRDRIEGGGGNDLIRGGDDIDVLRGDDGNDIIEGQSGADRIYGGAGDDLLFAFDFDDAGDDDGGGKVLGNAGDDILVGGSGGGTLSGQGGDDVIFGGDGFNLLLGGGGRDYIVSNGDGDRIVGGGGRDWINALSSGENVTVEVGLASGWDYITQGEDGFTGVAQIVIADIARDDMKLVWDYEVLESVGEIDVSQQNKAFGSFEFTSETLYSETRGGFAYLVTEDETTAINIGYVEGTFEQIVGEGRNFVVDPETGTNLGLEWRNEYRTTASLVNDHEIYLDGGNTVLAPFISEILNVKTEGTTILADSGVLSGQAIEQDNIRKYEKTPDKVQQNFDNEFAQFNGGGLIAIEAPQDIADILTQDALDILGADVFAFV